jgi:hypothetical protein
MCGPVVAQRPSWIVIILMMTILHNGATKALVVTAQTPYERQLHVYPLYRTKDDSVPSIHRYPWHRQRKNIEKGDAYDPDVVDSVFQEQGTVVTDVCIVHGRAHLFRFCLRSHLDLLKWCQTIHQACITWI